MTIFRGSKQSTLPDGSVIATQTDIAEAVTAAQQAQAAAESAESAVESTLEDLGTFPKVFYGPLASDPASRNDGTATEEGDLYYNTTDSVLKIYNGSTWEEAAKSDAVIKGLFSADGDIVYDSNAGEFSVTTYKDSDVEAYLSAGAGINYSSGNISHGNTSTQSSVTPTTNTFISGITLDTFGHITSLDSETISNAVTIAQSITEIQASSLGVGNVFSLNDGGRSGIFDVLSGDFSSELAADTQNGLYIGLSDDPNATTKVAKRRYSGPVNIEWFGAVGDNSTNNATAIQAALDNASYIFVPQGKFKYFSNVTKTGGSLTLVGTGQEMSEFVPVGSSTFSFIGGTPQEYDSLIATFSQVSWRQSGNNSGNVVNISFTGGSGSTAVSTNIDNCEITGESDSDTFKTGFSLFNARNLRISKVRIMGDRDGGAQVSENGILIDGNGDPVEFFIESSTFYFVQNGIKRRGSGEGIYINQCAFVAVTVGIDAESSNNEPLFYLHNSHINSTFKNIRLRNIAQYDIAHNLFYGQSSATEYLAIDVALDIPVNVNSRIAHNTFVYTGSLGTIPVNGILIDASDGVSNVLIDGNTFQTFDTAVIFGSGCLGATVTDTNDYKSVTDEVNGNTANNIYAQSVFNTDYTSVTGNSGLVTKTGTSVIILDSAGNGVVGLQGAPFPNEFRSGVVCNGSPNDSGDRAFVIDQNACTTSSLVFSVRPNPGAVGVRVNWVAYGR